MECPFSLNDKVMHPQYGAGYVISHQVKEVNGEKITCLEIDTLFKKTKIFIPVENVDLSGLRKPISTRTASKILKILDGPRRGLPRKHRIRILRIEGKLKDGTAEGSARVIRELYKGFKEGKLSMTERRIYDKVYNLLASEIAIARNISLGKAMDLIESRLERRKKKTRKKSG
ncbi:MAG: CarD family transcriptional regulator [Candidatus Glassbacteria bacterium]